jgi:hypothetical protein
VPVPWDVSPAGRAGPETRTNCDPLAKAASRNAAAKHILDAAKVAEEGTSGLVDLVHGEFVIRRRLASGTDRGNGAAKRSDQGRPERAARQLGWPLTDN